MKKQIGEFEKKHLIKCGKKDAKKYKKRGSDIVDESNVEQTVYMQFINREIARCLSIIHITKNKYIKQNLGIEKSINRRHFKIKILEEKKEKNRILFENEKEFFEALKKQLEETEDYSQDNIGDKQESEQSIIENEKQNTSDEEVIENVAEEGDAEKGSENLVNADSQKTDFGANIFENKSPKEVMLSIQEEKQKKLKDKKSNLDEKLERKILKIKEKKQKKDLINDNFEKALTEECRHFYSMTLARISAYWTGVQTVTDYKLDIIKYVKENNVFSAIDDEINKLKSLFKDEKNEEEMNNNE